MFYDNYVKLCEEHGEKPTPVAQKLGCSSSNVALWKKGSVPRSATLGKIADYFGVTTQYLLFGQTDSPEIKKETSDTVGSLSDKDIQFVKWFRSLSPEKQRAILTAQDGPVELAD